MVTKQHWLRLKLYSLLVSFSFFIKVYHGILTFVHARLFIVIPPSQIGVFLKPNIYCFTMRHLTLVSLSLDHRSGQWRRRKKPKGAPDHFSIPATQHHDDHDPHLQAHAEELSHLEPHVESWRADTKREEGENQDTFRHRHEQAQLHLDTKLLATSPLACR